MTIGERISMYREQKGMTQEQLAKLLDIAPQNVYKYEKGVINNIPLSRIEKMSEIFGVTPGVLVGWEEPASASRNEALMSLMASLETLTPEQLASISNVVDCIIGRQPKQSEKNLPD
jgi:transcriptional regulator with XRE-family HTH domain